MKPERLTNKSDSLGYTRKFEDPNIIRKITHKLGQHDDIEEDLGIDLVTLFKALKYGVYDKRDGKHLFPELLWNTGINDWTLYCDDMEHADLYWDRVYRLREYGKTWALTKEELE